MNMRDYFSEAVTRYDMTGDVRDGREAVRRAWANADACWAMGDRESGAHWEDIAAAVLS